MSNGPGALKPKDPDSEEPYGFDWTPYLEELSASETIATSTWAIDGGDSADVPLPATVLTIESSGIVSGAKKTQVVLSGGTPGQRYRVRNRIATSSGAVPVDDRSFRVLILER